MLLGITFGSLFLLSLAVIAVASLLKKMPKVKEVLLALVFIYLLFGTMFVIGYGINNVNTETPPSYSDDDMPWH